MFDRLLPLLTALFRLLRHVAAATAAWVRRNPWVVRPALLVAIFCMGSTIGFRIWWKIGLPYHNPDGIIGPLTALRMNPANNVLRFLVFILLPSTLLTLAAVSAARLPWITSLFQAPPVRTAWKENRVMRVAAGVLALALAIGVGLLCTPRSPALDMFHEGETLGMSVSYLHGRVPYRDVVFVHGLYQDPVRATLAFRLFGHSIGAVRTVDSLGYVLALLLMGVFLLLLYRGRSLAALLHVIIMGWLLVGPVFLPIGKRWAFAQPRDAVSYAFLIVIALLLACDAGRDRLPRYIARPLFLLLVFLYSLLPIAAFLYSIDRGFYLLAAYLGLLPFAAVTLFRRNGPVLLTALAAVLGLAGGCVALVLALQGGFPDFVRFTLLEMPRYKELMDGLLYPLNSYYWRNYLAVLLLFAANTYWLVHRFLQMRQQTHAWRDCLRAFADAYLMEIALWLLSTATFRHGLGRSDESHILYGANLAFLFTGYIAINHYLLPHLTARRRYMPAYAIVLLLAGLFTGAMYVRIAQTDTVANAFPVHRPDDAFLPGNYQPTLAFLRERVNDRARFVTLTNEASWYYLLDHPCPIRFPIVWFAVPTAYQRQIVAELQQKPVTYVLYRNAGWWCRIDGIENETRLPIVFAYVRTHFHPYRTIDTQEIWIRNGARPDGG